MVVAIFVAISACVTEASGQRQGFGVASGPLRFEERLVRNEGEYIKRRTRTRSRGSRTSASPASARSGSTWHQEADGLHIRAMRAQRLYTGKQWPNAVTLKITHAQKP